VAVNAKCLGSHFIWTHS